MDPQKELTLPEIILKLHQDHAGKFAIFYGLIAFSSSSCSWASGSSGAPVRAAGAA